MDPPERARDRLSVLVLGGTRFVGRHVVETLLRRGHRVTTLTRGVTLDDLPQEVERLRGDRDEGPSGLSALTSRTWDACVDVSGYTAVHVRSSASGLRDRIGRYVYISAVSVYGDPSVRPVRETHPTIMPVPEDVTDVNGETYGPLKATCEGIVAEQFPGRSTILRPQIIVGPHDPSGRYPYWVKRAELGGEVLVPGDGTDHVQVVDVRDAARFVRKVVEQDIDGVYNIAGPRLTWSQFVGLLGVDTPVWVPKEIIAAAGLSFLELPLYRPEHGARSGLMDVSNDLARERGLEVTDPIETVRDTREWLKGRGLPGTALSPRREAELIAATRQAAR
jgi:2'-hydroxyisoflavone reductase